MMRILSAAALLAIAALAMANPGELTPQQAMDKMMNCPVCSAYNADPALGPTLRYSIEPTKSGCVETMATSNEGLKASFDKASMECKRRYESIPKMSAEDKGRLCELCTARLKITGRKDVTFENLSTPLGSVSVASANSADGVKALHEYAASAQKQAELIAQASQDAQGTMKSKM